MIAFRSTLLLLAFSLAACTAACGQGACLPPDSMKAQLQGTPPVSALNDLGEWFGEHKQYDCAASAFAASLQAQPEQKDAPHIAFEFGASLDLSGDLKEAIPALQEAEQLGYRNINLYIILAQAFDATHATKEAEAEWREALEFDPEVTLALDSLSNDLLSDKDYAGVITLLDVPRLRGQRTSQQALNLAAAYSATSNLDKAAELLRDSLNTSPDSAAIADRLAGILITLNHRDEAISLLRLTIDRHPDDTDAKAHLALLLSPKESKK